MHLFIVCFFLPIIIFLFETFACSIKCDKHFSFKSFFFFVCYNGHQKTIRNIAKQQEQLMVDAEEYSAFLRYKKTQDWIYAIKKGFKVIGRLSDGPRRGYNLLGQYIDCLVDTGSPINVIDERTYSLLDPNS
jgi:hypothetical protein